MAHDINVAVIGLGSMGYGMAQSLLRAGIRTHDFELVATQEDRFRAEGGSDARRIAGLALLGER